MDDYLQLSSFDDADPYISMEMDLKYLTTLTEEELSSYDEVDTDVGKLVMKAIERRQKAMEIRDQCEKEVGFSSRARKCRKYACASSRRLISICTLAKVL